VKVELEVILNYADEQIVVSVRRRARFYPSAPYFD
jgi:hypothetical protein